MSFTKVNAKLRRKLGVIMGDNVVTGINASINSGTIIGVKPKLVQTH